jgi:hypothetical protein
MIINEIFDMELEAPYSDSENDHSVPALDDLRKIKLTLGQINQLRLIRDVRNFELKASLENIRKQYGKVEATNTGF